MRRLFDLRLEPLCIGGSSAFGEGLPGVFGFEVLVSSGVNLDEMGYSLGFVRRCLDMAVFFEPVNDFGNFSR